MLLYSSCDWSEKPMEQIEHLDVLLFCLSDTIDLLTDRREIYLNMQYTNLHTDCMIKALFQVRPVDSCSQPSAEYTGYIFQAQRFLNTLDTYMLYI